MTIKETIIAALVEDGYDTFSASEFAQAKIAELKLSPAGRYVFQAGKRVITVDRAKV